MTEAKQTVLWDDPAHFRAMLRIEDGTDHGATDAELRDALHHAREDPSPGWWWRAVKTIRRKAEPSICVTCKRPL
jgi:hypothetical protein